MIKPTPLSHCDKRIEWETLRARGEIKADMWKYQFKRAGNINWIDGPPNGDPTWDDYLEYRIIPGPKHPDNQKPKLRLIDKSKLPRGTMTTVGEILYVVDQANCRYAKILQVGLNKNAATRVITRHLSALRIAPQERWTAWTGGECPIPEGVSFNLIRRGCGMYLDSMPKEWRWEHKNQSDDVIAYQIIGPAFGWTDDENRVN
ncbi:MAG: hypothetical protein ACRDBG_25160 [Waterburya sp.]